jgi:hypothetical protein
VTVPEALRTGDELIVRYLLGLLPDSYREQFDEASIEDDEFATQLRLVEDDLIDDYVRRNLPARTLARFEAYYLSSPQRRERVRRAAAFLSAVDRDGATGLRDASTPRPSVRTPEPRMVTTATSVARAPGGRTRLAWTVSLAAAVVFAVSCALVWTIPHPFNASATASSSRNQPVNPPASASPPPQSAAEPSPRPVMRRRSPEPEPSFDPQPIGLPPNVALILPPQRRTVDEVATAAADVLDGPLAIELQIDAAGFSGWRAALRDPALERIVWRSGRLVARRALDQLSVTVVIPHGLLQSKRYWLELSGRQAGSLPEIVGSYVFQIRPRSAEP